MYGTLISSVTVGAGGATSIDFTSIPQTYTDLVLVVSARATNAVSAANLLLTMNTSSNFYAIRLLGDGAATSSNKWTTYYYNEFGVIPGANATASTFANHMVTIPNYAGSTKKSISLDAVTEQNATTAYQRLGAYLFDSTSAITSLSISTDVSLAQYSTAYLYGLLKGSGGATAA